MLRHLLSLIFTRDTDRPAGRSLNWISIGLVLSFVSQCWGISTARADNITDAIIDKKAIAKQLKVPSHLFLEDGVYLYGQSPQPDQLGQAYMVFEVIQGRLIGGFYTPRSSFDCFSGKVEGNQLALNIVDSYSQEVHDYSIAYSNTSTVAASTPTGANQSVSLEGFHLIETLSQTDNHVLNTCQADFNQN
ncbi:MAG: hypothetical protein WBA77_19605 [Microcoleaceae cyanobacterium]